MLVNDISLVFIEKSTSKSTLFIFREYTFLPIGSEGTLPVLFIPGSQGSAIQVRSIATIAFEIPLISSLNYTYEFFTLSFFGVLAHLIMQLLGLLRLFGRDS